MKDTVRFTDMNEHGMGLPEFQDLSERLRFSPKDGRIWLDDQRMVLVHVSAIASLKRELIETLGTDQARGLLTRMGHTSGVHDARLATKVRPGGDAFDVLTAGPALHAIEGMVSVEPIKLDFNIPKGTYYGEFLWRDSAEVDAYMKYYPPSTDPVCWGQIGYACGYTSHFMGKQILYREVECRGMGHENCRIIGKPVEDWDDPTPDIYYFQTEPFAQKRPIRPTRSVTADAPDNGNKTTMFNDLVGTSSGFITACHLLERVAETNATVLFLGETGVGKEMFAQALHRISKRSEEQFIAVNCAAIPDNLVEAELFGVEKGAFTGATASRPGRFERAHEGTLFLDEIGSLNLVAQGKMLRALQEGEVERVGDIRTRDVDVRVIAATNVDLKQAVDAGEFREDLWFRLNIFPIRIPPLRERRDDIPLLMDHFLRKYMKMHGKTITGYTERAINAMLNYDFPGNIRELENMVERAVILVPKDAALDIAHLFSAGESFEHAVLSVGKNGNLCPQNKGTGPLTQSVDLLIEEALSGDTSLCEIESRIILGAVEKADGNLAEAARRLNLTRPQLSYRYNKIVEDLSETET